MEKNNNVKKDGKKTLPIIIAVVAVIAVIVILVFVFKGGKSSSVTANLGEPQWMEVGQTLTLVDGSNKVTFTVSSDKDLIKTDGDYEYEVSYVLTVNGQEYTGTHKFGNGYSVHNENNGIPYNIDMIDFDNNTIQVSFVKAEQQAAQE